MPRMMSSAGSCVYLSIDHARCNSEAILVAEVLDQTTLQLLDRFSFLASL